MNQKVLAAYRREKLLELIGRSTVDRRQIIVRLQVCDDQNMKFSEGVLAVYLQRLIKEKRLFFKTVANIYNQGSTMSIYQRKPFKFERENIEINLPFGKKLSLMMGYASCVPRSRGKSYREHEAVKSMPAQTNKREFGIQSSMGNIFYGA